MEDQQYRDSDLEGSDEGIGYGECFVCGMPLMTPGGCAETGMCGPCTTGEADTLGEF